MLWRAIIAGLVVAGVSELADRYPRLSALLLTLPVVSIIAFIAVWTKDHNLDATTRLARETLVLVPLGQKELVGRRAARLRGKSSSRLGSPSPVPQAEQKACRFGDSWPHSSARTMSLFTVVY